MKLPDHIIQQFVSEGKIKISPAFLTHNLRPVGLRIHLGTELLVYEENQTINLSKNEVPKYRKVDITQQPYLLQPGEFVLGVSLEKIWTEKNILCELDGRSTIARLGMTIHNTSKIADGTQVELQPIVLEICNHSPLKLLLKSGIPIGCVTFELLYAPTQIKSNVNYYSLNVESKEG